jgi:RNA polymerase sigma factor (sigma-70 family)
MIATRRETRSGHARPSRLLADEADRALVEAVRGGDDSAFEELYRRYQPRIAAYVRRMVRDRERAEDLAQDAFFSALRRMRATDAEIAFKPWIFEIARNAAIDHWRRTSRVEELSVEADEDLRGSDRGRLVGAAGPDSTLASKERFEHLRGAFDELSDVHSRVLVMRELEGLSYREIAERLDLSRSSVESALFRARRRLETEYADISEGRRCAAMRATMARLAEGLRDQREEARLARHARRCHVCRRRARELGVEPLAPLSGLRRKAAALLPLPLLPRRGDAAPGGAAAGGQGAGALSGLLPAGAQVGAAAVERAAALVAAVALAGAGGIALHDGGGEAAGHRDGVRPAAVEQRAPESRAGADAEGAAARSPHTGPAARRRDSRAPEAAPGADRAGDGAGETRQAGSDGAAASGDAVAPVRGADGAPGTGDLDLPALPAVPPEVGADAPSEPSGDAPRLPEPPAPPPVEEPSTPDVPLTTPRVDPPPPPPVEAPAVPGLPRLETDEQLDAVTAITEG